MDEPGWEKKYDAPEGQIWICHACGKKSKNRVNGPGRWDEACFLNSDLYPEDTVVELT